jgi:hypothetical protein
MNETKSTPPIKIGGAQITRFNALRHGVLSRYTVLPWEDAAEYRDLLASVVAEHAPHGPTEEHLVEELAGILWRKRRLRLAEAAVHRHGLEDALSQSHRTAKRAVVHIDATDGSEDVAEAIRAASGSLCPPALWSLAMCPIGRSERGPSRPPAECFSLPRRCPASAVLQASPPPHSAQPLPHGRLVGHP